jgi:hypothetical protein
METPKDFLEWFSVPRYKNVYVLGSFAERVTLFSQQVRALNLIAALVKEKIIHKNRVVAVVGGGAAGLTAAAAAAIRGANVILLEGLYGVMESQRNNRQRWIHPHIYDWPAHGSKDEEADLPILGWSAAYAEQIVNQIERQWEHLYQHPSLNIDTNFGIKRPKLSMDGTLQWQVKGDDRAWKVKALKDAIVILAVGFGLEPDKPYQGSYWTEDDIDGGFRSSHTQKKWLVSGFGDGSLTDLMRLCITHFRHGNIVDVFRTESGIVDVEEQLKMLPPSLNESPELLTNAFRALRLEYLVEGIRHMKREGIKVFLTGRDPFLYGPKASVLNRLIVRVLEQMGAFALRPGPTKRIVRLDKGYLVKFGNNEWEYFDRVLLRHGPKPRALKASFPQVWKACTDLRNKWSHQIQLDPTQKQLWRDWKVDFKVFEQGVATSPSDVAFQRNVQRLGVRASKLVISKELRNDGSSTITYEIRGLKVSPGKRLSGVRLTFESTFGQIGSPELDHTAQPVGFKWRPDAPTKIPSSGDGFEDAMKASQEAQRRAAGTMLFPEQLTGMSNAINFAVTVKTLNADALSKWEYEQLYAPNERVHVDGKGFNNGAAIEYLAQLVWFPVDALKLRVTLPRRIADSPRPSVFKPKEKPSVTPRDVIKERILQNHPSGKSWKWERQPADDSVQWRQLNSSGLTWELSATRPPIGTYYSVDWLLPNIVGKGPSRDNEKEAANFRRQLLRYRTARMKGRSGNEVGKLFQRLGKTIYSEYRARDSKETFAISLLTYDQSDRHLKVVDAMWNGGEPSPKIWDFWLPFGQGLSGFCFKQQDNVLAFRIEQDPRREALFRSHILSCRRQPWIIMFWWRHP